MMNKIVKVEQLKKIYVRHVALEIQSLELVRTESFGLVGNNGAGKTTFFRTLLDLLKPTEGRITISGKNVAEHEDWKKITGAFLDNGFLIPHLSPEEYFNFVAKTRKLSQGDINEQLALFEKFFNNQILGKGKYIRNLSRGNQKKVGIAASLLGRPELLVLDEPFANLDPSSQFELRRILSELDRQTNTTILVSSHDLNHIAAFCKRIVILDEGVIVKDIYSNEKTLEELQTFFTEEVKEPQFNLK